MDYARIENVIRIGEKMGIEYKGNEKQYRMKVAIDRMKLVSDPVTAIEIGTEVRWYNVVKELEYSGREKGIERLRKELENYYNQNL